MTRVELVNNTKFPESGVRAVEDAMDRSGFLNPYLRVAVLSTVAKESSFKPKSEYSYRKTSNSRLRKLFSRLRSLSDTQLTKLKNDDVAFYEKIYGGKYGNKEYGDGYKYRGRGFNQLTFRGSYEKYGKLAGHDLENNPDLLNNTDVAADVLIAFMKRRLGRIPKNDSRFSVTDMNEFKDQETATFTVVSANHGFGSDVRKSHPETLEKARGYSSIFQYPKSLFDKYHKYGIKGISDSFKSSPTKFIKRNWIPITIIGLGLAVGGFFLIKNVWKK